MLVTLKVQSPLPLMGITKCFGDIKGSVAIDRDCIVSVCVCVRVCVVILLSLLFSLL